MNRILVAFCLILTFGSCTSKFQQILKNKDTDFKVKMAEKYYQEKKYSNAQQLFESVMPFVKGTPRYEELYLQFANSYYYDKDYQNAENLFKTLKLRGFQCEVEGFLERRSRRKPLKILCWCFGLSGE